MRSTIPKPEMPAPITAPPKPLAFQTNARSPLFATLVVVAFVHVLVIVLLLSHFGWLGGSDPEADPNANAGQSGIVIPVTLEAAQSAEETPAPEPEPEPRPESDPEPAPKPESTPESESRPDSESKPESEPQPETQAETQAEPPLEPEPVSIPTPLEPRSGAETGMTPAVKPTPSPPAQTRANNEAMADSGKPAGSMQQITEAPVLPLTAAYVDPNYLHRPNPVYPALSKRLREEGTVVLRVNLDTQGNVLDITIEKSSSFQRLDQAALEAVKQWRFVPAKRGQVAMPSSALVPIEFKQQ
jgi:protein TonB